MGLKKRFLLLPFGLLAACGTKDPMLGNWTGDTDPSGVATSYKLSLKTDADFAYTYEETIVTQNGVGAESLVGCTIEVVYSGGFSDNPYDDGGVLSLGRAKALITTSGCADEADNAASHEDAHFEPAPGRYLYRKATGKTVEMYPYQSTIDTPFQKFTKS